MKRFECTKANDDTEINELQDHLNNLKTIRDSIKDGTIPGKVAVMPVFINFIRTRLGLNIVAELLDTLRQGTVSRVTLEQVQYISTLIGRLEFLISQKESGVNKKDYPVTLHMKAGATLYINPECPTNRSIHIEADNGANVFFGYESRKQPLMEFKKLTHEVPQAQSENSENLNKVINTQLKPENKQKVTAKASPKNGCWNRAFGRIKKLA